MKIVIDIPEYLYKAIKSIQGYKPLTEEEKAIANGTPLPKHGRLKDVDWIDDNCDNHYSDKDGSWCYAWKDIDDAPTIIGADTESEEV